MAPEANHAEPAADLATLFDSIRKHTSFVMLDGILKENAGLKEKNRALTIANELNDDKIAKFRQELESAKEQVGSKDASLQALEKAKTKVTDDYDVAKKQLEEDAKLITKLHNELKKKDNTINGLKESLADEKEKTKRLSTVEHELGKAEARMIEQSRKLERLDAFAYKLTPLAKRDTPARLDAIFKSARNLAETYFNVEFQTDILANSSLWDELKDHELVRGRIPLPLANTPAAKQMRTAAFLAVLSQELESVIFQPAYLLDDDTELSELLSHLAIVDPQRESYLRSVLLATLPAAKRQGMANRRAEKVATSVFSCVGALLPAGQRQQSFRSALDSFCKLACDQWQPVQQHLNKVEPSFQLTHDQDWKFFSVSEPPASRSQTPKPQQNGNGGKKNKSQASAAVETPSSPPPQQLHHADSIPDISSVAGVVWPSFLVIHPNSEPELLTEGFVLSEDQVKTAKDEEKAGLLSGPHRAARRGRRSRTLSQSVLFTPALTNGHQNGHQNGNGAASEGDSDNKHFLSAQVGGGHNTF